MTFREKHLWISIVSTVLIWGVYYWRFGERVLEGGLRQSSFAWDMGLMFAGATAVVVVIELVLTLIAHLTTSRAEREARDERETLAALKASHVSLMALIALIVTLSGVAYFAGLGDVVAPGAGKALTTNANAMVVIANVLLLAIILSEMIRFVFTVVLLRRGR
jgi:hypothetical protein